MVAVPDVQAAIEAWRAAVRQMGEHVAGSPEWTEAQLHVQHSRAIYEHAVEAALRRARAVTQRGE